MTLATDASANMGYRVDVSRGSRNSRVAKEWLSRPDDERFLNLNDLREAVLQRKQVSETTYIEMRDLDVYAPESPYHCPALIVPHLPTPVMPNHWSFGQLCRQINAPMDYLTQKLTPALATENLRHGLKSTRSKQVQLLTTIDSRAELRAITGADYGRIWDLQIVEQVMRLAGDGVNDTNWKVPGSLNWSTMVYNPHVDPTKESTTLYASDRDIFIFLVDDTNPIEVGKLPSGDPDLYFRGFYCWNSEVGSQTFGLATFFLRAVCMNRNLWGVEGFREFKMRHSKHAADRFASEVSPALQNYSTASPATFINGITAARRQIVAATDEDRLEFLAKQDFSKADASQIIQIATIEEDRPPETIFDFVQGITAYARLRQHQDARVRLERKAENLLRKAN